MKEGRLSKVSVRDENLWKTYGSQVAVISSIVTLISFCLPPSGDWKWRIGCSIVFILVLEMIFIWNWNKANLTERADLVINETKIKPESVNLI